MMLFKILTFGLIAIVLLVSLYFIRQYLVYLNFFTIEPPKSREKLRDLSIKRQKQQHKVTNVSVTLVIVFALILSFILFSLMSVKKDTDIIKDQVTSQKKKSTDVTENSLNTSGSQGTSTEALKNYKDQEWSIDQYDWQGLLKNDKKLQTSEEIALSSLLKPYIGENNLTIIKGTSLTVSIVGVGLSQEEYNQAQDNLPLIVADLNKEAQVSIVDFTLTFYDNDSKLNKKSRMFYQENGVLKEMTNKK